MKYARRIALAIHSEGTWSYVVVSRVGGDILCLLYSQQRGGAWSHEQRLHPPTHLPQSGTAGLQVQDYVRVSVYWPRLLFKETNMSRDYRFVDLVEREWLDGGHHFSLRHHHVTSAPEKERAPVFLLFLEAVWQVKGFSM